MARPQQVTDTQILAAARQCFLAHGPAVAVARIAEQLGVSHAALLQRLGSKDELLRRAFAVDVSGVIGELRRGPTAEGELAEELERLLGALLIFLRGVIPGLMVLRASGLPLGDQAGRGEAPTRAMRRDLAGWLGRASALGLVAERSRAWAELLLGALEARCFNAYLGGARFVEGSDRAFLRSLVQTLTAHSGRPEPRRRVPNGARGTR